MSTQVKIYEGFREQKDDGLWVTVTVDGSELDPSLKARDFGAHGYDWGIEGANTRQLAFAMLADAFDVETALRNYRKLYTDMVAARDVKRWRMSSEDLEKYLPAPLPPAHEGADEEGVIDVDMDLETLMKLVRGEQDKD